MKIIITFFVILHSYLSTKLMHPDLQELAALGEAICYQSSLPSSRREVTGLSGERDHLLLWPGG